MQRNISLFATLFGITILFICLFTTYIFVHSFGITDTEATRLYILSLSVTAIFITAFATSRHSVAKGRNTFYIFAMTIGGYGMYLFIVSLPLALLLIGYSVAGTVLPMWIPTLCFAVALLLGVIGHIQSSIISVKKYVVGIPNLAEWWHGKRVVLVTDTHFGLVRKERFAQTIIQKIKNLSPDVVFHGGDFYDGPDINMSKLTALWKELAESIPIFYAPGNHEMYGNYAAFIASLKAARITVLEDTKTMHEGLCIAGITYRGKKHAAQARRAITALALDPTTPSILINHPPTFYEAAHAAGVSLMLSGHTHNGQFWPVNYIVRLIYGKYTYGTSSYKDMTTITARGVGTAGPPMRLFNPPELVVITFKNRE
ncbi:MAG TPA: metallophosphoesterase [Candidatus Paceibacterota bacterium]|nr:metallophosphoesterase [Candidatus Paceibacterota bacterium]